jgi:hypothetical protein
VESRQCQRRYRFLRPLKEQRTRSRMGGMPGQLCLGTNSEWRTRDPARLVRIEPNWPPKYPRYQSVRSVISVAKFRLLARTHAVGISVFIAPFLEQPNPGMRRKFCRPDPLSSHHKRSLDRSAALETKQLQLPVAHTGHPKTGTPTSRLRSDRCGHGTSGFRLMTLHQSLTACRRVGTSTAITRARDHGYSPPQRRQR